MTREQREDAHARGSQEIRTSSLTLDTTRSQSRNRQLACCLRRSDSDSRAV